VLNKCIKQDCLLPLGFAMVVLLMIAVTSVGVIRMKENNVLMTEVVTQNNVKINLVRNMYIVARERSILLLKMLALDDPFERDELYLEFNVMATQFSVARSEVTEKKLGEYEVALFKKQADLTRINAPLQGDVVELIVQEDTEAARDLLFQKAIPGQDKVLANLRSILDYEHLLAKRALDDAGKTATSAIQFMFILAVSVILLSFSIAVYVVRKTRRDERLLIQAEEDAQRHQRDIAHVMRLSTMGEMATGMAHELNQPLAAIVMYCGAAASLVNSLPSPPQQLSEILEWTKEQAHRAGDIIRNLREFVSKESKNKETFELDQVIQDVITLFKWEVQENGVKIELHPGGQTHKVTANKIQIEQVLVNLVRNSLDAIGHEEMADGLVIIQPRLLSNDMIEVSVSDNGPGIDATMAGKVFDQFQTSKGTGMGIGLSLSRSIVEAHGGKLWVEESHQNGALFGFKLPVSE
jgi:C4-dicarboxylate-specific signal transduction histidine kinase